MKDIDNTNNYNNYMDKNYNPNWSAPAGSDTGYSNYTDYKNDQELQKMYSRTVSFDIGVEYLKDDNDTVQDAKRRRY